MKIMQGSLPLQEEEMRRSVYKLYEEVFPCYFSDAIIKELKKNFDGVEKSIFKAAENVNLDSILGWEKNGIKTKYLEVYDEE